MRTTWKFLGILTIGAVALAGCIGQGTHIVTPKLQAGTSAPGVWHTFGGNGCFWERLSGTSGTADQVISYLFSVSGPRYVEIKDGDKGFKTENCLPWAGSGGPFDKVVGANANGEWGNGDFMIGHDIEAGNYVASNKPGCTWQRLSGFGGEATDVIQSSYDADVTDLTKVTIKDTDVGFRTQGCGVWKVDPGP